MVFTPGCQNVVDPDRIIPAGATLVGDDLPGLTASNNLSRGSMSNIRQNLFFAFIYNALGVPATAGLLYPIFESC